MSLTKKLVCMQYQPIVAKTNEGRVLSLIINFSPSMDE